MMNNRWWWLLSAAAVAAIGIWFWQASPEPVEVLAALGLTLTAAVVAVWQSRVQAMRRLRTALDAYTERTLARDSRQPLKSSAPASARRVA